MRLDPRPGRADADAIALARAIRFRQRLQRPGQIEDLHLGQHDEDYVADTSISSFTSATVMMRAKRLRSTASVRSTIASVDSDPIGNVAVASVMKSTS